MSKRVANKKGQASRNKCYANSLRKLRIARNQTVKITKRMLADEAAMRKPEVKKPTFLASFKNMFRRTQKRV